MTVWLPPDCVSWRYDFQWRGTRYTGSTLVTTRAEAEQVEETKRKQLRRRAAGLEPAGAEDTPRFSDWAKVTLDYATTRKKLKRPEQFAINLRMILGFWGARPTKSAPLEGGVYRDLRLGDPILDPELIEQFEQWMDARGISGPRKNHYRSACSVMYKLALKPAYRKRSQVASNPFEHIDRDRVPKRIAVFSGAELRKVIQSAAWHVRVALAIGALAPKLRLRNVLTLQWEQHVARDLSVIIHPEHKTDRETGLPLVVHVSDELRKALQIAKQHRRGRYVVHYRGKHVKDIKTALKHAVKVAGLTWGKAAGVTFHSLRHTMATELARMGLSEVLRTRVMGWANASTASIYTHMAAADEAAPLEALGVRMPLADVIGAPVGKTVGPRSKAAKNAQKKRQLTMRLAKGRKRKIARVSAGRTRRAG